MSASRRRRSRRLARRGAVTAIAVAATFTVLAACAFGPPPPDDSGAPPNLPSPSPSASTPGGDDSAATATVVAKHLSAPWGLAFLPDGSALVTERKAGTIVRVGLPATAAGLTVTPVATVAGVTSTGDGGLLGIAVSPKVATNHTVFVYYSTATDNRIATIQLPTAVLSAPPSDAPSDAPSVPPSPPPAPIVSPHPIVTGIPHGATDNGGWLGFGPDGSLYASTGDAGRPATSADRKSLAGKILRMTVAGKPVSGKSLVYASGLHDVQGFDWDPTGHLYAVDAATTTDGVLAIRSGASYGWPATSGSASETATPPIQTLPAAEADCAGVALVQNILATACLAGERIWVMQLTANGAVFGAPQASLAKSYGRLRTVVAAPDGSLWITTSNTDGHGKPSPDDDQIIQVVVADAGAGKS
jgi:glucose/arabinose dehydrogenase